MKECEEGNEIQSGRVGGEKAAKDAFSASKAIFKTLTCFFILPTKECRCNSVLGAAGFSVPKNE